SSSVISASIFIFLPDCLIDCVACHGGAYCRLPPLKYITISEQRSCKGRRAGSEKKAFVYLILKKLLSVYPVRIGYRVPVKLIIELQRKHRRLQSSGFHPGKRHNTGSLIIFMRRIQRIMLIIPRFSRHFCPYFSV